MSDDVMYDGSEYKISLVKLNGKKIKDIIGYVAYSGGSLFLVTNIIFEDGTSVGMGGEHDMPYIEMYDDEQPGLTTERLDELRDDE